MRAECAEALRTQRMPTTRNEEYRYTDLSAILQASPHVSLSFVLCGDAGLPLHVQAGLRGEGGEEGREGG